MPSLNKKTRTRDRMIFKNLWERHLCYQILKVLLFTVGCFYILYVVIDYSIHSHHFSKTTHFNWVDLAYYYFYLFMKRADLILPIAFIIASNNLLLNLNQSHAMIALFVGGLNKLQLLRPFFTVAFFIAALLLINFEYVLPKALTYLDSFEHKNFKKESSEDYSITSTYHVPLGEHSTLIFAKYDYKKECFEDVYYIEHPDSIWKMKRLQMNGNAPQGFDVEHLIRDPNSLLIKQQEYDSLCFQKLPINLLETQRQITPCEQKSLSSLYNLVRNPSSLSQMLLPMALTQLSFKLSVPFISFLFIIACTPFCITFSRKLPIFMIYAMSIFGVITFFIVMDAAVILGENQIFSPWIAVALPYLICLAGFGRKFIKTYFN